jgi:hypothetical protein
MAEWPTCRGARYLRATACDSDAPASSDGGARREPGKERCAAGMGTPPDRRRMAQLAVSGPHVFATGRQHTAHAPMAALHASRSPAVDKNADAQEGAIDAASLGLLIIE